VYQDKCEGCGLRPRRPGLFDVAFKVGYHRVFKTLCARCIPSRLSSGVKFTVEGVR
jgi:hypothetical protein